ncbi:hypothetical protein LCGC14_3156440, partial [marine sediment metagenome]
PSPEQIHEAHLKAIVKMVPVVAGIIQDKKTRKILISWRQDDTPCWEFPGGKIEPGEQAIDALHRELWEELEVKVHIDYRPLCVINNHDRRSYANYVVIFFACTLIEPGMCRMNQLAREHIVEWIDPPKLTSIASLIHPGMIEAVRDLSWE